MLTACYLCGIASFDIEDTQALSEMAAALGGLEDPDAAARVMLRLLKPSAAKAADPSGVAAVVARMGEVSCPSARALFLELACHDADSVAESQAPPNWHQGTVYAAATQAPEDASLKAQAPVFFCVSILLVIFQTCTVTALVTGTFTPACISNDQCEDVRPNAPVPV